METHGVPTIGYKTKEFPAFYTRKSGFNVDYQLDTPKEIADVLKTKWAANLNGGVRHSQSHPLNILNLIFPLLIMQQNRH